MKQDKNRKLLREIFQALSERKALTKEQVELWDKYNKKRGDYGNSSQSKQS